MNFTQKQLQDWIACREKEMVEDIRRLVRIPSIAEQGTTEEAPYGAACKAVLEEMRQIGREKGFNTENHGNRLVSFLYGEGDREIGIWGHLDVVPEGEGWKYPPFDCTRVRGFLIGRGTQDNKGPAIAVLYAMAFLKEKGFRPEVRFRQILGCMEEQGMEDAEYYLAHEKAPDFSFVSDCRFPVCCGEKGILNLRIRSSKVTGCLEKLHGGTAPNAIAARAEAIVRGKHFYAEGIAGHAAFPEGGKNALGVLCRQLLQVPGLECEPALKMAALLGSEGYGFGAGIACSDEKSGRLTCNLGTLELKQGRLEGELDIRYPVTKKAGEILKKLEGFLDDFGCEIIHQADSPPYFISSEDPRVQCLSDAYRQAMHVREPKPYTMGGGTYARKLPRTVGFGPGMPADLSDLDLPKGHGNGHGADEAQSIKNLQKAIEIYVYAMLNLSNYYGNQEEIQGKEKAERAE